MCQPRLVSPACQANTVSVAHSSVPVGRDLVVQRGLGTNVVIGVGASQPNKAGGTAVARARGRSAGRDATVLAVDGARNTVTTNNARGRGLARVALEAGVRAVARTRGGCADRLVEILSYSAGWVLTS